MIFGENKEERRRWQLRKLTASVDIEIAFYDTDAMGVVWHGNYLKYFELARCALLQKFDYGYLKMLESGYIWPIVECQLKYMHSGVFGQPLRVEATLVEYENRLKIAYQVIDCISGERLTKGYTVQVAVDAKTRELQFVSPEVVFKNLEKIGIAR
jgi:acyl-CoA thioester hydrolase